MKKLSVAAAVAPLMKVQKNLQAVVDGREASANHKRTHAHDLMTSAEADEDEQAKAEKILANLLKLTEG